MQGRLFVSIVYCIGLGLFFFLGFEETEVHTTVDALLHEAGVLSKAVVLAMLEDEHALGCDHASV